jgi:hypothetical protein
MRTNAEPEQTWTGAASGEIDRLSSSIGSSMLGGSHGEA